MLTLAMAQSIADGMEPEESLEIDGDAGRLDLWYTWPDGSRSIMTTWQLDPQPVLKAVAPCSLD